MKKIINIVFCLLLVLSFSTATSQDFSTTAFITINNGLVSIDTEDNDLTNLNCSQNLPQIPLTIKFNKTIEDVVCQTFNYTKVTDEVEKGLNISCEKFDYDKFYNGSDGRFREHTADMKIFFDEKVIPKQATLDGLRKDKEDLTIKNEALQSTITLHEQRVADLVKANKTLSFLAIAGFLAVLIFIAIELKLVEKAKKALS